MDTSLDQGNSSGVVFPKAAVRRIMKLNDEVGNISAVMIVRHSGSFDILTFLH